MTKSQIESEIKSLQESIARLERERDSFDPSGHIGLDDYDDMLDDVYGDVEICGGTYSASDALKSTDPVAYRCGYNDYCNGIDLESIPEYQEILAEIDSARWGIIHLEEELAFISGG